MSMLAIGLLFAGVTLLFMMSGAPIAFALGAVAVVFMAFFMPAASLDTITQNVYEEMASITLLSIPLLHPEGRRDRPLARRPGPVRGAACVDEPRAGGPRHRQRVRVLPSSRRWPGRARRRARRSARPASRR
jgi:hypothetical protein